MGVNLIKEIRGSMTGFHKLTPEHVASAAEPGLTYEILAQHMAKAGLDIEKVVFDPSRKLQNAFFADYENGRYCEIYLQKSYLDALLEIATMNFPQNKKSRFFEEQDWLGYYRRDVPVPMLIYDFQRRYKDIEESEVFSIWLSIHTRIDFANDMWPNELLEYVFDRAPVTVIPETDEEGLVIIYRGMGELSQPPEKAISWTTNRINALWFANRSGFGTKLLVARIRPEQIVAYCPGFQTENEVILRPGTPMELWEEDMIPASREYVPNMLLPATWEFFYYCKVARTLGYSVEQTFRQHGMKHILRVLLLSLVYYYNSGDGLSEEDKKILIYFSLLHDIGRDSEFVDENHGVKALRKIRKEAIRIKELHLSPKGNSIARLLILYHCREDSEGIAAINSVSKFSQKDKARARKLYAIAKDMDGLDRVRFNGLDYHYLRTPYARKLPLVAGNFVEEPLFEQLCHEDVGTIMERMGRTNES